MRIDIGGLLGGRPASRMSHPKVIDARKTIEQQRKNFKGRRNYMFEVCRKCWKNTKSVIFSFPKQAI